MASYTALNDTTHARWIRLLSFLLHCSELSCNALTSRTPLPTPCLAHTSHVLMPLGPSPLLVTHHALADYEPCPLSVSSSSDLSPQHSYGCCLAFYLSHCLTLNLPIVPPFAADHQLAARDRGPFRLRHGQEVLLPAVPQHCESWQCLAQEQHH